jgi:hypothetical protein
MSERMSAMPVAVINPWLPKASVRYVMVADQYDAARVRAGGWEILRGVEMHIDEDGIVQVDDR